MLWKLLVLLCWLTCKTVEFFCVQKTAFKNPTSFVCLILKMAAIINFLIDLKLLVLWTKCVKSSLLIMKMGA